MKKRLSTILVLVLIITNLQVAVHAAGNMILAEDFDGVSSVSGLDSNWSFWYHLRDTGEKLPYTPTLVSENGGKALQLTQSLEYDNVRAVYTFSQKLSGAAWIRYSVKPGEGITTLVSLDDNSDWITTFSSDHSLSILWAGNEKMPYTLASGLTYNQWYDVEVYVDFVGKKCKTTVSDRNGGVWESGVANFNNSSVKNLYFRCWGQNNASACFDNVEVEQIPLGFSVNSSKEGNIFDQNDEENFTIVVGNATSSQVIARLEWEVENDYTGEVNRGIIASSGLPIPANGNNTTYLNPNIEKFGTYTMSVRLKYYKNGILTEDNMARTIKFSKILASNNGERNSNFGFSVNTLNMSPGTAERAYTLMDKAGASGIRTDWTWFSVQSSATEAPSFSSTIEAEAAGLVKRNMTNQLTLCYGNTNIVSQIDKYGNPATPSNNRAPRLEKDIKAFGDYCAYMAEQTKDYIQYYEIWNEWDGAFNADNLGPEYYIEILKEAYSRIKAVYPEAVVLSCSFGNATNFEYVVNHGYNWCDGFVIHGYMQQSYFPNKYWLNKFSGRLDVIRNYENSNGLSTRKELYFNENGISTATDYTPVSTNWLTVSEKEQAEIVPKYVAFARGYDLTDQIYWYSFLDKGVDRNNIEACWGIMYYPSNLDKPYIAKPAYAAISAMNKLMNGGITNSQWDKIETIEQKERRIDLSYGSLGNMDCVVSAAYAFDRGEQNDGIGKNLAVLWSDRQKEYTLNLGCSSIDVYDLFGNKTSLTSHDGVYKVHIDNSVAYLAGDFTSFEEATASISTAEYDANKNILHISGFVNGVNATVNADLYKGKQFIKQVPVKINNGTFNKLFSITESGTYTIKLGSYAQTDVLVSPISTNGITSSTIGGVSIYLDEDMKVCIRGRINNFANDENVSIVIVPSGEDVTQSNILYINQLEIENDGSFSDTTEFYPLARTVDVYIGATNAANNKGSLEFDTIYKVKTLAYDDNGSNLSVSAIMYNTTEADKDATIYISQFDDFGKMIDLSLLPIVVKRANNKQVFEFSANKRNDASSYKAFIWDMTDGKLRPLCNFVDFSN